MSPKMFVLVATLCVVKASVIHINFFNEESETSVDPQSVSGCYYRECQRHCQRLGYSGGACVNGRCKCDNLLSLEYSSGGELKTFAPMPVRNCYFRECEQRCRRFGYPGGACVDGRCKCDDFLNAEYSTSAAEIPELLSSGRCYRRECIYRCRQQGYKRGICINDHCQCNNYESTEHSEDSSSVTATPSGETTDNEIDPSPKKEKEGVLTAPRTCDAGLCSHMCHSIWQAGGWCRGGLCQCY